MFLYKVIHRVIHRLCISHNSICKVIMEIKVKTLCKLALQVTIKTKINGKKTKKNTLLYNAMYSIFKRHSPYKAFIFLSIYLYICFIKVADTIPKNSWIGASLRYNKKLPNWYNLAIQQEKIYNSIFLENFGKSILLKNISRTFVFANVCFIINVRRDYITKTTFCQVEIIVNNW